MGMSLADLAAAADLPRPTIWRAETPPYFVKGPTLRKILKGLRLREGCRDWGRAMALWMEAKTGGSAKGVDALLARVALLDKEKQAELKAWLDKEFK